MECTNIEVEAESEEEGVADLESPFIVRKRQKWSSTGPHKKQKSDKSVSMTPLVVTEANLDKISYVVHNVTENIWKHIEDQYHLTLDTVQQGLREL